MKKRNVALGFLIMTVPALAQVNGSGNDLYSPTKLEWAVMELNVLSNKSLFGFSNDYAYVRYDFQATTPDTITVLIQFSPGKDLKERIELSRNFAHVIIAGVQKKHEWNWIKIKDEISPIPK